MNIGLFSGNMGLFGWNVEHRRIFYQESPKFCQEPYILPRALHFSKIEIYSVFSGDFAGPAQILFPCKIALFSGPGNVGTPQLTAAHYQTMQHTATHCSTLFVECRALFTQDGIFSCKDGHCSCTIGVFSHKTGLFSWNVGLFSGEFAGLGRKPGV